MSDSNKNTKHILTDKNNNNTDTHNGKMMQNGLDDNLTEQANQSSETISNKVESDTHEALEESKNSSEPAANNNISSNNKTVENKAVTISTNNFANNGSSSTPISPNTPANNGQTTMRYISYIPAATALPAQAFTTQQPQHPHMELSVTQNTSSISPQQWTTNKDGQLQAVPAFIPSSYQINQYDPQYAAYQNVGYTNYPNYTNMIPVEYSYGPAQPINNEHSHHNSNSRAGQYENGMGMNAYIQYIPSDHQHSYADPNAYQLTSNVYAPYKNVNLTTAISRPFNSHKHNKYTNDSSSGKSSSNKADVSFQNNTKNLNKATATVEEINGSSKQSHKWSDIVSGKNNENPNDISSNGNTASTSGEMNKENYDQENDLNESYNYYNYNESYLNKKGHSKYPNNFTKPVNNNTNNNSNGETHNYVSSNGKYHGKRQPEFYTSYGNPSYSYNQYGLDVNYQDPQYYNPQYQTLNNVNLIGTDFSNLNILSPSSLYNNSYNKSFLSYPFKSNKSFENKKFRLVNKSSKSPSDTPSNNNNPVEKYNPINFLYNGELENENSSRFFVIKSYSKEDVIHSIKNNIWCSTENGNSKLDEAFKKTINQKHMSIYLFFSVNGSGQFCGMAEMVSSVDYKSSSQLWTQNKWKGKFDVKWIFVKDVPNMILRHIHLPNNENKSVTNSRDTQEILFDQAIPVLDAFRNYVHDTTILDENSSDPFTPITYFNRKDFEYKKSWQESNKEKVTLTASQFKTSSGEPTIKKILTKGDKVKNVSGKPEEIIIEKNDS